MLLFFSSGQYEPEDDYDLYDSNEDEDDGGLGEEYEELHSPQIRPHFTTRPQHFKIPIGHSARLPCRVQDLGKRVCYLRVCYTMCYLTEDLSEFSDNSFSQTH